ncbi:NAD(P)/FAD-dependent oxidoreductase [Cellulomonas composti]|uniref:FAD-dependent oxidoreductase n=1 Tax=Cellulomonas composti TaxID=266130 RepID=A0A511J8M6_9CELL|nr:FAD-dependent oxidoreductase [Cellulomonas composti]GEL94347.1 FAD-dependent oxidoreductase [Cellulomonas composti]
MTPPPWGGPGVWQRWAAATSTDDPVWASGDAHAPLDGDTSADVVVVGAGPTGLWTAYYLLDADPALDVVVVDAAALPTGGRGVGACSAALAVAPETLATRFGETAAWDVRAAMRDAVVEVGGVVAVEQIACGFAFGGRVAVARVPAVLATIVDRAAAGEQWGEEAHVLDADGLAEHVRVPGAIGGAWWPDCARLDPGRLAAGLVDVVVSRGGRVHGHTRALRVSAGAVVTERGTVRAPTVVDARDDPSPTRVRALATAPAGPAVWERAGMARGQAVLVDDLHLVRTPDDRLVAAWAGPPGGLRSRASRGALLRGPGPAQDAVLDVARVGALPALAGAPVTHRWWRPLAEPGSLPRVGVDRGRAWARPGGNGPAAANVAGRTVAELVTGASSALTRLPWVTRT